MNGSDFVWLAIVAMVAVVPLAAILIVALLRGYTIDVHMIRDSRGWRRPRDDQDDDR